MVATDSIATLNAALEQASEDFGQFKGIAEQHQRYRENYLNHTIDSLKGHIEWLWSLENVALTHAGFTVTDPCAGMVSIEAVEALIVGYATVDSNNRGRWTELYNHPYGSRFGNKLAKEWQRLKEGSK